MQTAPHAESSTSPEDPPWLLKKTGGGVPDSFLEEMARPPIQEVEVAGRVLRPGSRVRLRPRAGGDLIDTALAGRNAVIEGIDQDEDGVAHVAVVIEDDPGRDLGEARHPAHRFFFAPGELEPVEVGEEAGPPRRVLVAGIGNVFLGDDGFGVVVAQLLSARSLPVGVEVADFGIRGMDLAYALGRGYHAAILVDAVPRGWPAGTLHVIEPEEDEVEAAPLDVHRMDPLTVLRLARRLGPVPAQIVIVGCEPDEITEEWSTEKAMRLSSKSAAVVETAADMVVELATRLVAGPDPNVADNEDKKGERT